MINVEYDYSVESLFENDYRDAQAYHKRALQFRDSGQAFSLVFNIASVALERYLVAICELYGEEPMNHNFISLMIAVDKLIDTPKEFSKEVKSLDQIFGICFLEDYFHGTPTQEDADKTLRLCDEASNLFDKEKIKEVKESLM
ncbi:HEPN domain-containing protein [Dysgonomonas capnocytophagoides]|uniref:HEPN domain-containing protein n=1 Tax=Dysgonomonas capnocytophagoides TaxID=45254 RepID=UPI0029247444|nr:hypothetical protein DCPSUM001_04570 [Dysgonomonas capnocytophagoides]